MFHWGCKPLSVIVWVYGLLLPSFEVDGFKMRGISTGMHIEKHHACIKYETPFQCTRHRLQISDYQLK
jgi:hypothetical protein